MILDSIQFHAMQSSLDALWMKQKAITSNLANVETPGYKAKQISFQDELEKTRANQTGRGRYSFKAEVLSDEASSARPDGNNVNADKENLELFNTYMQMSALYQKIDGQFQSLRYVTGQAFK